jgi:hypothetical protein
MPKSYAVRYLRHGISLLPGIVYAGLLIGALWLGIPALLNVSEAPVRNSRLIALKGAAEEQAVVYILHDLTIGRPAMCQEFANQYAKALADTGEGIASNATVVEFSMGLASWRRAFCAVSDESVKNAIGIVRAQPAARVLDDPALIGRQLWLMLTDSRRTPPKNFRWGNIDAVNLDGAILSGVDLQGVSARFSSMRGAQMVSTVLANADFLGADFSGVLYAPRETGTSPSLPAVGGMAGVENLETIRFIDPSSIYGLRAAFVKEGYRDAERRLTYTIEQAATDKVCSGVGRDRFQCFLRTVFMQWPTHYGLRPSRALQSILALVGLFSVLYLIALLRSSEPKLWLVWHKERVAKQSGSDSPEPLHWNRHARLWPLWALYFSIISASQIGWKEFTVGDWITRIQVGEYSVRATGWVRTVSGLQALISAYLLAIWALTYFGRPFG